MKPIIILFASLFIFGQTLKADSGDTTRLMPFHLSFVTPLGTNGLDSWNTTNQFSINLLAGFSGGLNGAEFAGFANALQGDMKGLQVAGFCNNTLGNADGAEIAGFWNYNHQGIRGLQAAGFANFSPGYVDGVQASGFTNVADGTSFGQFTGFANISTSEVNGVQASGFTNVSTEKVSGVQATGFGNVTVGDHKGVQAAGFSNIATGKMDGVQVAGFFNYTEKLDGVQVGVFNVADSVENGIQVGILSFAKNGYRAIEIGGSETLYTAVSFKTGLKQFYNIISVGLGIHQNSIIWGWGYGIGTQFPLAEKMDFSLEAICYHLNEDEWYTDHLNLLNRLNLTFSYNFNPDISLYVGPALNVWVTDNYYSVDPITGASMEDWLIYEDKNGNTAVSIYPGISGGIRIRVD